MDIGYWLLLALCVFVICAGGLGGVACLGLGLGRHGWRHARRLARRGRVTHGRNRRRRYPAVGGHPFVIALVPILVGVTAPLVAVFVATLGLALVRMAALADQRMPRRTPSPEGLPHAPKMPTPSSPPVLPAPKTLARALDASEIRARVLAEKWHREGRLSPAGYLRLCDLMYSGYDVYPYWSGGELHGTAVVWDGTRGREGTGERVTVAQWNAAAEHDTRGVFVAPA